MPFTTSLSNCVRQPPYRRFYCDQYRPTPSQVEYLQSHILKLDRSPEDIRTPQCLPQIPRESRPAANAGLAAPKDKCRDSKARILPSRIQGRLQSMVGQHISLNGGAQCPLIHPVPPKTTYACANWICSSFGPPIDHVN